MFVEGTSRKVLRTLVGAKELIKPHEQMTIIEFEEFVVHVMVSGCSESQESKQSIPGECVFGMDHGQPIGVETAKGHVGPNIGVPYNHGGAVEWNQNHANGIRHGSVECVKETRICEFVMRFV